MEAGKRSGRRVWVLSAVLLAFVAALLVLTVILVRVKLLQNAQSLGMALATPWRRRTICGPWRPIWPWPATM